MRFILSIPAAGGCGSGFCLRAPEPFVKTDAAEAGLPYRHERELLDPAAKVKRFGVAHDLTRVTDRLEIARDDFVERCSLRSSNLEDAISRRSDCHIGNRSSNVVRGDR